MADKSGKGISVGSASLVMIFSVLCLTVFSVLSLVTANNELRLSEKSAASVKNFYTADSAACDIINEAKKDIALGKTVDSSFEVKIDENRNLEVAFDIENDEIKITKWQISPISWEAIEETLPVWDGS